MAAKKKVIKKKTAKKKVAKRAVGRPTKYESEMCGKIIKVMSQGYSQEAAAAELGIAYSTFDNWLSSNKDFMEAVKEGRRLSLLWWEKIGRTGMVGKLPGFNAATWIFNMKNRHGWADKSQTDITSGGKTIKNDWHIYPVTTDKNGED